MVHVKRGGFDSRGSLALPQWLFLILQALKLAGSETPLQSTLPLLPYFLLCVIKMSLFVQESVATGTPQGASGNTNSETPGSNSLSPLYGQGSPLLVFSPSSCTSHGSLDSDSLSATSATLKRKEFCIPRRWKPSIMAAISEKRLQPETRNEIVRDLVTHMYAHTDKPDAKFTQMVARLLVKEYPFMADSGSSASV